MTDLHLHGNRVAITGAAGGLGRSFALSFAEHGARVLIADINTAGLLETEELLRDLGADVISAELDVTSRSSCDSVAQLAQSKFGGIDTLINNAAMYGGLERKAFTEIDENVWDNVMQINVKGVWLMTRSMTPLMQANNSGSIINVASATVFSGSSQWMHYVASKGAVIAMTRVMATELGENNIRANALAPGFTLTQASHELIDNAENYGVARAPLRRNAQPDDITGSALYLASRLSEFMTGQTLIIDGGKQFN